jgi:hypothetical protein
MSFSTQLDIPLVDPSQLDALHYWAEAEGESRGEVFTKPEVAEFILDLSGWRVGETLNQKRLLEPSCGAGDFVIPAIQRLLADSPNASVDDLENCIRAVEVNRIAFDSLTERVIQELKNNDFGSTAINRLTSKWLLHTDFLTETFNEQFTHVVGNPPYLRIEALPKPLMHLYRSRFQTMYDRSDLYVAFFEKGLSLLCADAHLGYICANRWMKNRYGGPLREFISDSFHLDVYVDFTGVDAFHGEVDAYPSVTIIRKGSGTSTYVIDKSDVSCVELPSLARNILDRSGDLRIKEMTCIADGNAPWLLSNSDRLKVIQKLEERFPKLEDAGCKVGIGVATGADKVYIGSDSDLDVESSRKLRLLTRGDLKNNKIDWKGKYVLNPFDGDRTNLVDLDAYPKFKGYIEANKGKIVRRHVAKKNTRSWFKTIDRIYPALTRTPKLVIPDIQGKVQVAYDKGEYYPHHNLYYVTSDNWNLQALQTVLRSSLVSAFVATYSLRMRGDFLRFQAQYLRRIRIPNWLSVPESLQKQLAALSTSMDQTKIDHYVCELYGLDESEWIDLCND